jgi:hypothetical protein
MPRNNAPAASTLRNRNRITNKTRLKIHQGSLDADAVLIPDEDEEKHRLTNLVAGVDAEDANVSATRFSSAGYMPRQQSSVAVHSAECLCQLLTNLILGTSLAASPFGRPSHKRCD